jgi:hypothetical protein
MIWSTVFYAEIWLGCTRHSGVNHTTLQIWHCCDFGPHIRKALATLRGNIYWKNIHMQIIIHSIYNFCAKMWELTRIGDWTVDFFANSKPYSNRLHTMHQGPRGSCLLNKTKGRKSRVRVPFTRALSIIENKLRRSSLNVTLEMLLQSFYCIYRAIVKWQKKTFFKCRFMQMLKYVIKIMIVFNCLFVF